MTALADLSYRFESVARRISNKPTIRSHGCLWVARSANAVKSVRLMGRDNPILAALTEGLAGDDVFVDIGANFGTYAIAAATSHTPPRAVYAFEPAPGPYLALLENIKLNQCEDRCHPIPIGIGNHEGWIEFQIDTLDASTATSHVIGDAEASHVPTGALWKANPMRLAVPCSSIDVLVATGVMEAPTVVKIDVEGFETEVIKGMSATLGSIRRMAVEVHPDRLADGTDAGGFVHSIEKAGFRVADSVKKGRQHHYLFECRSDD